MQLEISGQLAGTADGFIDPRKVPTDVGQAGAQAEAVVIDRVQVLLFQQAGHGAAAHQPAVEASALLIGEVDYLQGMAGAVSLFFQRAYDFDGAHDSQGAVVFAAFGDCVGVRAHGDGR